MANSIAETLTFLSQTLGGIAGLGTTGGNPFTYENQVPISFVPPEILPMPLAYPPGYRNFAAKQMPIPPECLLS
ncbi:MAG: hypothetical protein JWO91_1266 [Acidobacteriaceae bacterium]|jgi:hypothetical protein|nr:hypothetical protein [Acidobacteriaceae bacterium]